MGQPLSAADITHALGRTQFAARPADHHAWAGQPRQALVDYLMQGVTSGTQTPAPAWVGGPSYPMEAVSSLGQMAEEAFINARYIDAEQYVGWWASEMTTADQVFDEALMLFWQDHFVTSLLVHEDPQITARRLSDLRRDLGGNFRDLINSQALSVDMMLYLSGFSSPADAPNENLARELLELFTLGEGRGYGQEDVRELARALTGIEPELDYQSTFETEDADQSRKTILGQQGNFRPDDLAELIVSHETFGPYIVEKFWAWFISDQPDPVQVAALTETWRASDWDMPTLYRALLSHPDFWAAENRGRLVKSPFDMIIGTARATGLGPDYVGGVQELSVDMGFDPLFPPNVAGHPGGTAWINGISLTTRVAYLSELQWDAWREPGQDAQTQSHSFQEVSGDTIRINQAFPLGAWSWEEADGSELGLDLLFVDVGYEGQTIPYIYLNLGLWQEDGEVFPYAYFPVEENRGTPLATSEEGLEFFLEDGTWWSEEDGAASALGLALLDAAPALIDQRRDAFALNLPPEELEVFEDEDGTYRILSYSDVQPLMAALGSGDLSHVVRTPSTPGLLGLPDAFFADNSLGAMMMQSVSEEAFEQLDSLFEEAYYAAFGPYDQTFAGRLNFDSAADWQAALPSGTSLAEALLALPQEWRGAQDAGAFKDLLTSPLYQVK